MTTARLHPLGPNDEVPASLARELRECLDAGELAILPTETVYGIAARVDRPAGLERLRAVKGASERTTFTWHLANDEALAHFRAPRHSLRRIVARYWPGPLTLVLEGGPDEVAPIARDGWVGLRLPALASTRALLGAAGGPVVMSSANRSGESPSVEAGAALDAFANEVALVVDGGRCALAESSTVLAFGRGRFEILREGLIALDDLRKVCGRRLCFICTGNTCRSPMADALARDRIASALGVAPGEIERFGYAVSSCGVYAGAGSPASEHAVTALAEMSVDLRAHRSRPMIPQEVLAADHIFCLTHSHLEALRMSLPPGDAQHAMLLDPSGRDIPDPIGGDLADYRRCASRIASCVEARLDEIL